MRYLILPGQRTSQDQYFVGLGVLALIDGLRASFFPGSLAFFAFLLVLFALSVLHTNRLRSAGRSPIGTVWVILAGLFGKVTATLLAMTASLFPVMMRHLEDRGVDTSDQEALTAALQDPNFNAQFQTYLTENPQITVNLINSGTWPSLIGFWLFVLAVGYIITRSKARPLA